MDAEGEDIGEDDTAYLSNDDDYLEDMATDEFTDEEDYAFLDDEGLLQEPIILEDEADEPAVPVV